MSIDKIIIENFKIFEGQHIFDLNNLNIFTGANNSGKSTFFKAITLFAKSLERGDFPTMDLFEDIAGDFKNLINWNSKSKSFKIGFYIELGNNKMLYKVLYEFVEHNGRARFFGIEVKGINDIVFLSVNDTFLMESTQPTNDDISYIDHQNSKVLFISPAYDDTTPCLTLKLNISIIKKNIHNFTNDSFIDLFAHFDTISSTDGYWWAECLEEQNFDIYTNDLSFLSIENFVQDLFNDSLLNLGSRDVRNSLFWGKQGEKSYISYYNNLIKETKYRGFVKNIIAPIFEIIKSELDFFREINFAHVVFQNFEERVIKRNIYNNYLFSLFPYTTEFDGPNDFVRKSLQIFGIDGYVELKYQLNSALVLNLVTGLNDKDIEIKAKLKKEGISRIFFNDYKNDYIDNDRQNIADLGKGTGNLIGLILKVFSAYYENKKRKWKYERVRKALGHEPHEVQQKLLLIEEPEVFLHPDWQSKLADFFVYFLEFSSHYNIKIVIETHSVYLIQRLQYLVATRKVENKNINVVFFEPDNTKAKFYDMNLRKDGVFANKFGSGFYDESARLTISILNAQSLS